jgi:hypothetical protein
MLGCWTSEEALSLGVVYALTYLIRPLSNCPGLSQAQQINSIESIEAPDLSPKEIHILEGDRFILLRNIDTRSGLAKGRRWRALELRNRTVVLQFDDDEKRSLTRIPMEKTSNGMKFVPWQLRGINTSMRLKHDDGFLRLCGKESGPEIVDDM